MILAIAVALGCRIFLSGLDLFCSIHGNSKNACSDVLISTATEEFHQILNWLIFPFSFSMALHHSERFHSAFAKIQLIVFWGQSQGCTRTNQKPDQKP